MFEKDSVDLNKLTDNDNDVNNPEKKWFSVLCEGEHNRNLLGLRNFSQHLRPILRVYETKCISLNRVKNDEMIENSIY